MPQPQYRGKRGQQDWLPSKRLIGLLLLAAAVLLLIWKVPEWQAGRATDITAPSERVALENELRRTLATVLAGVFVLVTGYIAWRNMRLLQEGQALASQGQITERFTRAIEQLGATHDDGTPKLELRLGGIYALERIARESATDHGPVMEILTAYVREHARERNWPAPMYQSDNHEHPRVDVQAVMTVIGRRARTYGHGETQRLDLRGIWLRGADLRGAQLAGAHLNNADLQKANLRRANLQDASLPWADLQGADLRSTIFSRALLFHANLQANLEGAILLLADLRGATIGEASINNADFTWANVEGVDFSLAAPSTAVGLGPDDRPPFGGPSRPEDGSEPEW